MRLPHYRLETYGFRVTNGEATLAYTGDTGPSERIAELGRDADLFVCEATLETGESDGEPRGHLSAEEALEAYAASGARNLLLTHRPSELPAPEGVALAYDGMEVEVVPQSVRSRRLSRSSVPGLARLQRHVSRPRSSEAPYPRGMPALSQRGGITLGVRGEHQRHSFAGAESRRDGVEHDVEARSEERAVVAYGRDQNRCRKTCPGTTLVEPAGVPP